MSEVTLKLPNGGHLLRLTGTNDNIRQYVDVMMTWINDPEIRQYLKTTTDHSYAQEVAWIANLANRLETDYVFAIYTADDMHIGSCGLHKVDQVNEHAEFGIYIGNKNFWSKHYGRMVLSRLCQYAFGHLGLSQIFLGVWSNNPRGQHCYESCGFTVIGRRPRSRTLDGTWLDLVDMCVDHSDFVAATELDISPQA